MNYDLHGLDTSIPSFDSQNIAEVLAEDADTKKPKPHQVIKLPSELSHRTKSRRLFYDFSQVAHATRLIKTLPTPDETVHCVMDGTFNGIALVPAIIDLAAVPCENLIITTLGFNLRNIECLIELAERGLIKRLSLLCSDYYDKANRQEYAQAKSRIESIEGTIRSGMNHSKILLLDMGQNAYVVESSANLRSCSNVEQFTLTNSRPLFQFHKSWIDCMFAKE